MDLNELKNIWQEEDKRLDHTLKLNENLMQSMNLEKITSDFNQMFQLALAGRNLALVYCLASFILAILTKEISYSLPAMAGGLAMLWSFRSHLVIQKPNYYDSIVQLQKTIYTFRMHMAANAKYDLFITAIWMLTFVPLCLKYFFNISLYSDLNTHSNLVLILALVLTFLTGLSQKTYKTYNQKLKESETYLAKLIEFEKN